MIIIDELSKYNLNNNLISRKALLMWNDVVNMNKISSDNIIYSVELNNIKYKDISGYVIVEKDFDNLGTNKILGITYETSY